MNVRITKTGMLWRVAAIPAVQTGIHPATAQTFTEFPLPIAKSRPAYIVAGPDGALWFTEIGGNRIGRITTRGTITEYPVPTPNSEPYSIAAGWKHDRIRRPDPQLLAGQRYFGGIRRCAMVAEESSDKIGRITTKGAITEFPPPTPHSLPRSITLSADGALWFTERADRIGRITTDGAITEFTVPTVNASPYGIATAPDGTIWFTEQASNKIGKLTPAPTARD